MATHGRVIAHRLAVPLGVKAHRMRVIALTAFLLGFIAMQSAYSAECAIASSDNPNITYSINPNVTYRLNPDVTYAINPDGTYSINPNVTYRYNPRSLSGLAKNRQFLPYFKAGLPFDDVFIALRSKFGSHFFEKPESPTGS